MVSELSMDNRWKSVDEFLNVNKQMMELLKKAFGSGDQFRKVDEKYAVISEQADKNNESRGLLGPIPVARSSSETTTELTTAMILEEEVGMFISSSVEVTVQDDQELNGDELESMELYHHNRQEVVKANGSSSREESDLRRKQIDELQRESERVAVPESALEIFVRVNGVEPRRSQYLDRFLGEWASEIHENKVNATLSRLGFPNLPTFSGVNPYDWVEICEEFFDINPSLEVCKGSLVADLLMGKAKAWYWSWCVRNEEADWDEFVDALCEHFGNKEQLDNVESSVVKKPSDFEEESQVGLKEDSDLGCKVNDQEVAIDRVLLVKSSSCILVEGLCEIEDKANNESDSEKEDVLGGESNRELVENFSECEGENQDGSKENFCDFRLESQVWWDRFEEVHGKEDDLVKLWSSIEMGEYGQYRGRPPDSFFKKGHNEVDDSGLVRPEIIKRICLEVKDGCKDQVFCEFGRENLVGMKNDTDLECDISELVIQDIVVKAVLGSNGPLDVDVDLGYFDVKSKPPDNFGPTKEMKLSCLGGVEVVQIVSPGNGNSADFTSARNGNYVSFVRDGVLVVSEFEDGDLLIVPDMVKYKLQFGMILSAKYLPIVVVPQILESGQEPDAVTRNVSLKLKKLHVMSTTCAKWFKNKVKPANVRVNYKSMSSVIDDVAKIGEVGEQLKDVYFKKVVKMSKSDSQRMLTRRWEVIEIAYVDRAALWHQLCIPVAKISCTHEEMKMASFKVMFVNFRQNFQQQIWQFFPWRWKDWLEDIFKLHLFRGTVKVHARGFVLTDCTRSFEELLLRLFGVILGLGTKLTVAYSHFIMVSIWTFLKRLVELQIWVYCIKNKCPEMSYLWMQNTIEVALRTGFQFGLKLKLYAKDTLMMMMEIAQVFDAVHLITITRFVEAIVFRMETMVVHVFDPGGSKVRFLISNVVQLAKNLHSYRLAEMVFLSWLYKLFDNRQDLDSEKIGREDEENDSGFGLESNFSTLEDKCVLKGESLSETLYQATGGQ